MFWLLTCIGKPCFKVVSVIVLLLVTNRSCFNLPVCGTLHFLLVVSNSLFVLLCVLLFGCVCV